ncbi:OprO/OprP family phosphate-selective porin [Sandaracinobacteroides hominis]|uniref:OprO/OprP family phosphate-selective porin n=1 Tax=Sandaracinobacteroides hominis TaxID=2780086 RepID=UPI0018F58C72|nr:porin [Sandaracinobacteroides hominis]
MAIRRLLALVAVWTAATAQAQETTSIYEPIGTATGDRSLLEDVGQYGIPDPVPRQEERKKPDPFRISVVAIGDYTTFGQDDASVDQLGVQEDKWQIRALRLSFLGTFGSGDFKLSYQVSGEYKGFDSDPNEDWQMTDISITLAKGDRSKLTLGKTKETFAYEMVGDSANLPVVERVLSPFYVSRNTGARFTHVWGPNKRGTLSFGVYNDDWDIDTKKSARRGVDSSVRLTALVWDDPADDSHYLHVGASFRNVASKGELRYRGRPGTNASDNFIDTGSFDADGALHMGLEAMLALGPISVQGEYTTAWVDAPTMGNPSFDGWYVTGSWILTGDHRPYDRNVGYARRVVPKGRWGAHELIARWSDVDLRDSQVDGGRFRRIDAGYNWWATQRWKFGLHYGHVWLDRFGERGQTDTLMTRLQWVY